MAKVYTAASNIVALNDIGVSDILIGHGACSWPYSVKWQSADSWSGTALFRTHEDAKEFRDCAPFSSSEMAHAVENRINQAREEKRSKLK